MAAQNTASPNAGIEDALAKIMDVVQRQVSFSIAVTGVCEADPGANAMIASCAPRSAFTPMRILGRLRFSL